MDARGCGRCVRRYRDSITVYAAPRPFRASCGGIGWRNPRKVGFVWHTKHGKAGTCHTKAAHTTKRREVCTRCGISRTQPAPTPRSSARLFRPHDYYAWAIPTRRDERATGPKVRRGSTDAPQQSRPKRHYLSSLNVGEPARRSARPSPLRNSSV